MTSDNDHLPDSRPDEAQEAFQADEPPFVEPHAPETTPEESALATVPRPESPKIQDKVQDIEPQPAPARCGVCGEVHLELYAHLPIETDAYLAAVAAQNRRSRRSAPPAPVRKKPTVEEPRSTTGEGNVNDPALDELPILEAPSIEDATQDRVPVSSEATESLEGENSVPPLSELEDEDEPTPGEAISPDIALTPLNQFPHGTAWRCYNCGALSLVWPDDYGPISPQSQRLGRRRSSAEFREAVMQVGSGGSLEKSTEAEKTPAIVNRKRLRALDLNLGRGTHADRNLAVLHELGLSKHQLFGISHDSDTIEQLNLSGYQAYEGTLIHALSELPDNYFDLVLGFNAIEYWRYPAAILECVVPKLRKGGRVVLELANPDSWQAKLFRHGYWASYQTDRRLLLGESALHALAERVGLRVESVRPYPEPQAWKASSTAWSQRKRHPLRFVLESRITQKTLIGLERLRATCGMKTSRYGAVLFEGASAPEPPPATIAIEDAPEMPTALSETPDEESQKTEVPEFLRD